MFNKLKHTKYKTWTAIQPWYFRYYKRYTKNSYPDFLIIGALKSGTTSLYQYLSNHKELISSETKETNFFSWEFHKGIKYYLNHFPLKKEIGNSKVFEACPHYLPDPNAAKRIKLVLPNVKIIAILRDPIKRAISNYNYFANPKSMFGVKNPDKLDKRTVNQAFKDDLQGNETLIFRQFCRLSLYAQQLIPYYERFKPEDILVLDFGELKKNPKSVLKKIADFIGIEYQEFESFEESNEKVSSNKSFNRTENKKLNVFNALTYEVQLDEEMETELIEFYNPDVIKLQKLTGTSFSWSDKYL